MRGQWSNDQGKQQMITSTPSPPLPPPNYHTAYYSGDGIPIYWREGKDGMPRKLTRATIDRGDDSQQFFSERGVSQFGSLRPLAKKICMIILWKKINNTALYRMIKMKKVIARIMQKRMSDFFFPTIFWVWKPPSFRPKNSQKEVYLNNTCIVACPRNYSSFYLRQRAPGIHQGGRACRGLFFWQWPLAVTRAM